LTLFSCPKDAKLRIFAQALRNFPQRFPGPKRTLLPKLSLFDPAYVLLLHAEGKSKLERFGAAAWLLKRETQGEVEGHTPAKDDRGILEILKDELVSADVRSCRY
jgi:hypothetical protein